MLRVNFLTYFRSPTLNKDQVIAEMRLAIDAADLNKLRSLIGMAKQINVASEDLVYKGFTLLHYAIVKTRISNQNIMIAIINELHQLIDVNRCALDNIATSPLHSAARRGLPKLVAWLLEHNADVTILDSRKKSALNQVEEALIEKILKNNDLDIIERLENVKSLLILAKKHTVLAK